MPFNDKKEWIDPDSIPFDIKDRERGYSVCVYCMKAVHLHQAGYEVELHNCNQCKSEVADIEHFLSADEIAKLSPKIEEKKKVEEEFKLTKSEMGARVLSK
ncbi:MAG: hypothetical protein K2P74_04515 [Nitrosomonas sp.]|nr:hypothetical protein [Nitrosomonas sp.]